MAIRSLFGRTDSHASVRGRTESSAPKANKNHAKRDVGDGVPTKRCMGKPPFAAVGTNWAEGA